MRTVQFTVHHAKFVLRCHQSCRGPLTKQVRYFRQVNKSRSLFVVGGFRIHFACFCFWMTFTIMIDGSLKRNRKLRVRMLLKSAGSKSISAAVIVHLGKTILS